MLCSDKEKRRKKRKIESLCTHLKKLTKTSQIILSFNLTVNMRSEVEPCCTPFPSSLSFSLCLSRLLLSFCYSISLSHSVSLLHVLYLSHSLVGRSSHAESQESKKNIQFPQKINNSSKQSSTKIGEWSCFKYCISLIKGDY